MDRYFGLTEAGTSIRTEALAGLTTFLTMAYILFVNPAILGEAGMPRESVFVATAVAAIAGSAIMGLYANLPVALAPGMGLNAYFAFVLVLAQGYTWQQALAAVFLSGMLFVILSVLPVREAIINAIPRSLKLAVSAGIGLFLGIIALKNAGIVVAHPATFVTLGNLFRWPALLCLLGFVLMVALTQRRVIGATIIGILAVSLIGLPLGLTSYTGIISAPPSPAPTLFALDFSRMFSGRSSSINSSRTRPISSITAASNRSGSTINGLWAFASVSSFNFQPGFAPGAHAALQKLHRRQAHPP